MTTTLQTSQPDVITKQLAFNVVNGSRKARVSSNFLQVMEFPAGLGITVKERDGLSGFEVTPATSKAEQTHQVYERKYNRRGRSNNPLETLVEFSGQGMLNRCFPSYTERFHVEMRKHHLIFSPIANRAFSIANKFKKSNPLTAFVGLTGGVDVHAMEAMGIRAEVILEHRPDEARDIATGRRLNEVHALNTLVNGSPRILLNEDIHHLEMNRLERYLADCPPLGIAHFSFGCDDFSAIKSPTAKQESIQNMTTMVDMIHPGLNMIDIMKPAVVVVENVPNFRNSDACTILEVTLRRKGYNVTSQVLSDTSFGSHQGRQRYYMVASVFPGFTMPVRSAAPSEPLWDVVERHLSDCRDITDTRTIAARANSPRKAAGITRDSLKSGTITKSQSRNTKDSIYIEDGGRVFAPSEGLIKEIMGIPDSFNTGWMAKELSIETMGQSVDYTMHAILMGAIRDHLKVNCGKHSIVKYGINK